MLRLAKIELPIDLNNIPQVIVIHNTKAKDISDQYTMLFFEDFEGDKEADLEPCKGYMTKDGTRFVGLHQLTGEVYAVKDFNSNSCDFIHG